MLVDRVVLARSEMSVECSGASTELLEWLTCTPNLKFLLLQLFHRTHTANQVL